MFGAFQKRPTRSTSAGEKPICAASWLARPPTSRPPIALGWPVSENGPMPSRPIRPVARWQLMMALTLSVPCNGLVDALRVERHDALRPGPERVERAIARRRLGPSRQPPPQGPARWTRARASAPRSPAVWSPTKAGSIAPLSARWTSKPAEQHRIRAVPDGEVQVACFARRGAARIDDDQLRAARFPRRLHALEQHGMAPRRVGADQHQQVRLVEVLIASRHGVRAERALVARDRRRHAKPRIGVDVGRCR